MKKINGITIYEENDVCSLDEYSQELEKDLTLKFTENEKKMEDAGKEIKTIKNQVLKMTLDNTKTNIKIQNLQTKTDNLEGKLEALTLYGQESGSAINITDSSAGPLKLNIKGNSIQEEVEPYNVLNVNMVHEVGDTATSLGITATYLADGKIQLNGTSTNFVDFYIGGAFEQATSVLTLPKGTYENYLRESSSANVEMFLLYDKTKVLSTTKTSTEFSIEESKNLTGIMVRVWQNVTLNNYIVEPKILKKTEERIVGENGSTNINICNKNMFVPALTNNNKTIISARANISLEDDTFVFECTGSDMYLGVITNKDNNYSDNCGKLTNVKDLTSVSVTITNELFTKNFLTCFDKNLVSLGVKQFDSNILNDYALPTGTEYVVLRLGMQNSVSGTTYKTKVQIEGGKASEYMPHEEQNFVIPVQEPMGSASDTFTKVEDVWVERHGSTDIACTQEQINVLNQLENAKSYKNVTHITSLDKAKPNLEVTYIRDLETFIKNLILSEGGN